MFGGPRKAKAMEVGILSRLLAARHGRGVRRQHPRRSATTLDVTAGASWPTGTAAAPPRPTPPVDDDLAVRLGLAQHGHRRAGGGPAAAGALRRLLPPAQARPEGWRGAPGRGPRAGARARRTSSTPERVLRPARAARAASRSAVRRPLAGLAAVPYYGCLTRGRPRSPTPPGPENPTAMDDAHAGIGVRRCRPWSYKTDCCGGSLTLTQPDLVESRLVRKLFEAPGGRGRLHRRRTARCASPTWTPGRRNRAR